jgi:hypothetical protein
VLHISLHHFLCLFVVIRSPFFCSKKTKTEVLRDCIAAMKPVYEHAAANVSKLLESMADSFSAVGQTAALAPGPQYAAFSTCGVCKGKMSLRRVNKAKDNSIVYVLYCQGCSKGYMLQNGLTNVTKLDVECPLCHFQVVQGQRGDKQVQLCPFCYNSPPAKYSTTAVDSKGNAAPAAGNTMPCFACANTACPLAKGRPFTHEQRAAGALAPCTLHRCAGYLTAFRVKSGRWMIACDSKSAKVAVGAGSECEQTYFFSQGVESVRLVQDGPSCAVCSDVTAKLSVKLVDVAFKVGTQLPPRLKACVPGEGATLLDPSSLSSTFQTGTHIAIRFCLFCWFEDLFDANVIQPKTQSGVVGRALRKKYWAQMHAAPGMATGGVESVADILNDVGMLAFDDDVVMPQLPQNHQNGATINGFSAAGAASTSSAAIGGRYLQPLPKTKSAAANKTHTKQTTLAPYTSGSGGAHTSGSGTAFNKDAPKPAHPDVIPGDPDAVKPPPCVVHGSEPVMRTSGPGSTQPNCRFWVCPDRPRDMQNTSTNCKVFVWIDTAPGAAASTGAAGTGAYPRQGSLGQRMDNAGRSGGGNGSGGASNLSCFKCGQTGHFANACTGGGDAGYNNNSGNNGAAKKRSQSTGPAGSKGATKPRAPREASASATARKCSICGVVGHTKAKCPVDLGRIMTHDSDMPQEYQSGGSSAAGKRSTKH